MPGVCVWGAPAEVLKSSDRGRGVRGWYRSFKATATLPLCHLQPDLVRIRKFKLLSDPFVVIMEGRRGVWEGNAKGGEIGGGLERGGGQRRKGESRVVGGSGGGKRGVRER